MEGNNQAELEELADQLARGEITAAEYTAKIDALMKAAEERSGIDVDVPPPDTGAPDESAELAVKEIRSAARRARAL